MIAVSHRDLKHWLRSCLGSMVLIPFLILSASGQQSKQLQAQLQQLIQQYEVTTHDLEQRKATLEQQIEKDKEDREKTKQATVSAVELEAPASLSISSTFNFARR